MNRGKIACFAAVAMTALAVTGGGSIYARAEEQTQESSLAASLPGWNQSSAGWRWLETDGSLHYGWLTDNGRTYYIDEDGIMVTGWREIHGDWYYFHQDGAMNLGELTLDRGCYTFTGQGALATASWAPDTGGGSYEAGCYDQAAQDLLDLLSEEKKDRYFDEHPRRQDEYDGDMGRRYDRYAGFTMNMDLNKAAAHRLEAAAAQGYTGDVIPGEGNLSRYFAEVQSVYRNRTLAEVYVRGCEDPWEAFEKIINTTGRKSGSKNGRANRMEYYRQLGMAHRELEGKHYFLVIFMR